MAGSGLTGQGCGQAYWMGISIMNLLPWKRRSLHAVALIALIAPAVSPLMAQSTSSDTEIRLRKVESEVAAIQRAVFPGGDGKFFPQLQSGTSGTVQPGNPASAPSADMLARMDALEGQVARLTAQVEEDHNRLEKMDARLAALEGANKVQTVTDADPAPATSSTDANLAAMGAAPKPVTKVAPKPAPKPAASDAAAKRVAAVKAVAKPSTKDAGDDEYSYGFRLWEAKFYPESEQQLKMFLQKYPKHARTSYARNLLGRNYLDDGNAHEAAGWFLQNYKTEPKGDRAPDSLLFLAESMRQLGDTQRGCVALKQFASTFPGEAAGRLKGQYDATAAGLKCK
ncbi:MAG: tetratricopeptide repeat protein [Novosphingobium sp.]